MARRNKTAYNASSTLESAANTAQILTAPAVDASSRIHVDKCSVFIKGAAAGGDIDIYCRIQTAEGTAYTYTTGTGVVSAITFTKGSIYTVDVGDLVVDDGTTTTYQPITAVSQSGGTFTIATGVEATYNGGAFKIYKSVQAVIGSGAARGDGVEFTVDMSTCPNGKALLEIDAGGASCVTVGNMPYRVTAVGE
jgi:hypothetical protein